MVVEHPDDPVQEFYYVIHKLNLTELAKGNHHVLSVQAPSWLIKHLVGRGGKKVKDTIRMLHNAGYTDIHRIQFIEHQ